MEEDGESELDRACDKLRCTEKSRGKKVTDGSIKRKTKELDWAHTTRRLTLKRNHRGKNGGTKNERKTATDDAGMDDDRRIQRIKEKSTEKRRMASLEVGTCRKAENLKKKTS